GTADAAVMNDADAAWAQHAMKLRGVALHLGRIDVHEHVVTPDRIHRAARNRGQVIARADDEAGVGLAGKPFAAMLDAGCGNIDTDVLARAAEERLGPAAAARPDLQDARAIGHFPFEDA